MSNFKPLGHLDTFAVTARLSKLNPPSWPGVKARGEIGDHRLPVYSLLVRHHETPTEENWLEDLPVREATDVEKWPSMRRLLVQAQKLIFSDPNLRAALDPTAPIGRAMISGLKKSSAIAWHADNGPYHEKHLRFHIPLVTNPLCLMYSQNEVVHMAVGSLWWMNNRCVHSAANWGQHLRLHLIFELRRAEKDDD